MTPLPPVRLRTGYAHKMKTRGIEGQAKQLSALVLVEGLGSAVSILPFVPVSALPSSQTVVSFYAIVWSLATVVIQVPGSLSPSVRPDCAAFARTVLPVGTHSSMALQV